MRVAQRIPPLDAAIASNRMNDNAFTLLRTRLRRFAGFEIRTSPEVLAVAAALCFTVLCNSRFWALLLESASGSIPGRLKIAASTLLLLSGMHVVLLTPLATRKTIRPALLLLVAANAFTIYFIDQFGVYVDTSMIRNVLQTDAAETAEILSWKMAPYFVVFAIVPALALVRVRFERVSLAMAVRRKALLFACGVAAIAVAGIVSFKDYSSFFRNHKEARYLVTPANYVVSLARVAIESGRGSGAPRHPVGTDALLGPRWNASERPVLFVIVVGETARASSFSLNGYERDTNPRLREVPGLVNFTDVSACGTSTADSLPCMFSRFGRSDPEHKRAREYESLLDVVSHAGLEVTWVDNNSGCKGVCDGIESASVGTSASPMCSSGECFDEVLLEGIDAEVARGSSAVLVLHQKGSHGPAYHLRYPPAFERFTPGCTSDDFEDCTQDEIRNAYDNSILYTDHVLAEMIERLASATDRFDTAMLYVSDHGESLGENGLYLHGLPYAIAPKTQTRVPMLFWASPGFESRFAIDHQRLAREASRGAFSHDNLFHSVLGALDIETAVYEPSLDVFAGRRDVAVTAAR